MSRIWDRLSGITWAIRKPQTGVASDSVESYFDSVGSVATACSVAKRARFLARLTDIGIRLPLLRRSVVASMFASKVAEGAVSALLEASLLRDLLVLACGDVEAVVSAS